MIVEFAGVSGAGKSALYGRLARRLGKLGYTVTRFNSKERFDVMDQEEADARFEAAYPGLMKAIEMMAGEDCMELQNAPQARHTWISGLARQPGSDICLLDEGFLHRCAYIAATGRGRSSFVNLLQRLPRPDMLVVPQVPVSLARDRVIGRMSTPRKQEVAAERFDRRGRKHMIVAEFIAEGMTFFQEKGVETVELDNTGRLKDAASHLSRRIEAIVPRPGRDEQRRKVA